MSHDRLEDKPWKAESQRASLRGFARLKAILWKRSLRLWEMWSMRGTPWFWKLHREIGKQFSGIDPHQAKRVTQDSDIFGETPILTTSQLLEIAAALRPGHQRSFADLGCGRGTTCLTAASLGYAAVGYEKEGDWVERASRVSSHLKLDCQFREGDFLEQSWPQNGVIFVVATAFGQSMRDEILLRLRECKAGTVIITGNWSLEGEFEALWTGPLPVDWGVIPFGIYEIAPSASQCLSNRR